MKKIIIGIMSLALIMPAFVSLNTFADDPGEPTYSLTFDFNGGATYEGQTSVTHPNLVSFGMDISEPNLVSCFDYNEEYDECHPIDIKKGKALAYVTVNDTRYEIGDKYLFNQDTTIVYYWDELPMEEYELNNGTDVYLSFEGEENRGYYLDFESYTTNMTEEELEAAGVPVELYEQAKAMVIEAIGENSGTLISFIRVDVYDEDDHALHEGPFQIRLQIKGEMNNFNTFKLIYLEETEDGGMVAGEEIPLTIEDGFLVGTLPHISAYALVGSNETPAAPNTGIFTKIFGSVTFQPLLLISSILFLIAVTVFFKKSQWLNSNNNIQK